MSLKSRLKRQLRKLIPRPPDASSANRPSVLFDPSEYQDSDITDVLQRRIDERIGDWQCIVLPTGRFTISRTIRLPTDCAIRGTGNRQTTLCLADDTNDHMFTNMDHQHGNHNIRIENMHLEGNAANQKKREDDQRVSYCDMGYFHRASDAKFVDISARDCRQTAFHFTHCDGIEISGLDCTDLGWSGVSTSGTDDFVVKNTRITNAGLESMHSAIHLDGGSGSYVECVINRCSGDGVMLGSIFSSLDKSTVKAVCTHCQRGISLSGDHHNGLRNVLIRRSVVRNNDIGIMVSNAESVFVDETLISDSRKVGVLLEGKLGGREVCVSDTEFLRNAVNVASNRESTGGYFSVNSAQIGERIPRESANAIVDRYIDVCTVCGAESVYVHRGGSVRESYRCRHCSASLRHRGQASAIIEEFGNGEESLSVLSQDAGFRTLAIYEPGIAGPFRKYLQDVPEYLQSYYWEDIPFGEVKDGISNQDLQDLRLPSESFDLVVSADVFEHVRRPYVAFQELHRVLKAGGKHIFTVPVQNPMPTKTVCRVDTAGDQDVFLLEPRYHIAGDGGKSLVYNDFGADMLERLAEVGFETKHVFLHEGHPLRGKNITFVSTKIDVV